MYLKEKHIDIKYYFMRDVVSVKSIELIKIDNEVTRPNALIKDFIF